MGRGGAGQGTAEEDGADLTTDGTEGGGPRDEAGSGSREGGVAGRAGEGRTIPGRKRITARGAVGGPEERRGGEKKAANEAKLEMIKQVMAQRFSDMPAARGCANEAIYERAGCQARRCRFCVAGSRTSPSPSASVDLAHLRPVRRRGRSCHPQHIL